MNQHRVLARLVMLIAASAADALAQEAPAALTVQAAWSAEQFVGGRTPLEFTLSRTLQSAGERFAMMLGTTDVSALLDVRGTRVSYRPLAARLPTGDSEIVAYLVNDAGEWREVGRFPLRVRSRIGVDAGNVVPSADLSSNGPLNQSYGTGAPPPDRRTYQDLTLRLGMASNVRQSAWQMTTQVNALAVTEETQRLRFGELQQDAPSIDLADYQVHLTRGQSSVSLGNVTIGNHRYLANAFGSRGVNGRVQLGRGVTLDAGVVNGTSVVGWANPFGVSRPDHRMGSIGLAAELLPNRPGALHVDLTGFDGSLLPFSSFNQGAVTDAEQSRGLGAQFALSDAEQRIRFTGSIAQSRFNNPSDPLLNGDTTVVTVRPSSRVARSGQLDVQLLRGVALAPSWPLSLAAAIRHERVDPMYRSVGTSVQADVENNGADVNVSVGALAVSATMSGMRDNLAEIASILTTRTRSRGLNAALPIGSLFGAGGQRWYWPSVNFAWQGMRQHGEGVPVNGDFSASHVPDQVSIVRAANLTWTQAHWNLAYRWNRSVQDNRQTGRELADFRTTVKALSLAWTPAGWISSNLDFSQERQKYLEPGTEQRTKRLAGTAQLQLTRLTSMSGAVSQSWGDDPFAQQRTRNTESHLEISQGFTAYRRQDSGSQGRLFIRYARTRAAISPFTAPGAVPLVTWSLTAGSSLRLY